MLSHVVTKCDDDDADVGDEAVAKLGMDKLTRMKAMKGKIKTIGRVAKMFATLKEESENLLKIKNMAPDGKIPRGLLLEGRPAIRDAL